MRVVLFLIAALLAPLPAGMAHAADRVLQVVAPWEISGLDPARIGYVFARMQVAETLLGADDTGGPAAALAESWSLDEDRLTWRFKLRSNARFHDGSPVDAASVAESLDKARRGAGAIARAPIDSVAADGADTVIVKTRQPFASLPAFLANYSAVILAPASYDQSGAVRSIIASGPYKVTSLVPPLKMEVERFADWWGPRPAIEKAVYLAVPRGETRALMAESGEADLVFAIAAASVQRLQASPAVDLHLTTVPRTRMLKVNAGIPFFDDVRERRAFSLALDRDGMAKAILHNPEAAANQLMPAMLAGWHRADAPKASRNVEEAKRLLAAAGWKPGPDGVLEQNGQRYRVQLRTFASWPELPVMATAIQAQLSEVGIELDVAVGNSSDIVAGHKDGSLQLGLMSRNFSLVPDPLGTLIEDFGPQGEWGAMNWSDPRLTELLERLAATFEESERAPLRREAAEILDAELPVIPISWVDLPVAVSKRLKGASVDPFELSYRISDISWAE